MSRTLYALGALLIVASVVVLALSLNMDIGVGPSISVDTGAANTDTQAASYDLIAIRQLWATIGAAGFISGWVVVAAGAVCGGLVRKH